MSRDRPKAQDIFEKSTFVFATKVKEFEQAFPDIQEVRAEVIVKSRGSQFTNSKGGMIYTKENFPGEYINCGNPVCYGGGFSLGGILREMIHKEQTHYEGGQICKGYEGSPGGRRRYRSCMSYWEVKVDVVYKPEAQPGKASESKPTSDPT